MKTMLTSELRGFGQIIIAMQVGGKEIVKLNLEELGGVAR